MLMSVSPNFKWMRLDYESAETLLKQAKAIDHNNISSYIRMGELEQRRGNTEDALNWYQEAALLPTADQSLNLTLIDSLISYGDYETALGYTRKALGQRPNDTELLLRKWAHPAYLWPV